MKRAKGSLIAACAVSAFAALGGDTPMKIMTYNVFHCESTRGGPEAIAGVINSAAPDFACLQEVDNMTTRSGNVDQTARLAELTGMHGVFAKAISYQGGEYGVAILSKEEAISTNTVALAGDEARVLLVCEFADVFVATAHLDNNTEKRFASVETVTNELAKCAATKPVFFMGDLNATPESDTILALRRFATVLTPESGVVTLNSRVSSGNYVIDYIMVDSAHRDSIYLKSASLIDNRTASDHAPLAVEAILLPHELQWVEERAVTTGRTGTWSRSLSWDGDTFKTPLAGEMTFTAGKESDFGIATIDVVAAFDQAQNDEAKTPQGDVQCAITIDKNGSFAVWTTRRVGVSSDNAFWLEVSADGMTPMAGVEYSLRFSINYAMQTYTVSVLDGEECKPLESSDGTSAFPLASPGKCVAAIAFQGNGSLASILGSSIAVEGFAPEETIALKDNASFILDAARAVWLNRCAGTKMATSSAALKLSNDDFDNKFLLNLDITQDGFGYEFTVTSINVDPTANKVTIGVSLVRQGKVEQAINGRLVFYGTDSVAKFTDGTLKPLADVTLTNDDFSERDTATATMALDEDASAKFYRAAIEEAN